jgi:murein DD-endopeptidase MepM/ murein hydrolase activator NlpD
MLGHPFGLGLALGIALFVALWIGGALSDPSRGSAPPPAAREPAAPGVPRVEPTARALPPPAGPPGTVKVVPGEGEAARPLLSPAVEDIAFLRLRRLQFPVPTADPRRLRDDFQDSRDGRSHEALDILAPRGTPVVAVDEGVVQKMFHSVGKGGLTVYHFDPESAYCYYYAHLDRYADGLHEGQALLKGDVIGYVGTTGNAPRDTPHLHFAIFKLGPEKQWWKGAALNPFPVWAPPVRTD